jgi:hypothetical protein
LRIIVANDFAVGATTVLPALGGTSTGVRILSESWSPSHDQLALEVSGVVGARYELTVSSVAQIDHVDGAELKKKSEGSTIVVQIPGSGADSYAETKVTIHFSESQSKGKHR